MLQLIEILYGKLRIGSQEMFYKKSIKKIESLLPTFMRPLPYFVYLQLTFLATTISELIRKEHIGDIPLPSPRLRFRVHGSPDARSFLDTGSICALYIKDALKLINRDLYSFEDVLDFGCGCARVLRWFNDAPEHCYLYGADIDGEAISWCRKTLRFASFEKNEPFPPLPYPSGKFDLVYAISVVTHLDEDCQIAWLKELQRVTKPNAVLIMTTNGSCLQSGLPAEDIATLEEKGFLYRAGTFGRFKPDGLPDFYQIAFHTKKYVFDVWSRFFAIHSYVERGMNNHQDLVLLLKI